MGGNLVQVQVVPELLHFQLHQLCPLQQVAVETLTGVTEAWPRRLLGGAAAAVVLLTVDAHVLKHRGRPELSITPQLTPTGHQSEGSTPNMDKITHLKHLWERERGREGDREREGERV